MTPEQIQARLKESLRNRGYIKHTPENNWGGIWEVKVPSGCKRRKFNIFRFDFRGHSSTELEGELAFSQGNSKLRKTAKAYEKLREGKIRLVGFNLPALLSCPSAGSCVFLCYALQGNFARKNVQRSRARNLAILYECYRRGTEDPAVGGDGSGIAFYVLDSAVVKLRIKAKRVGRKLIIRIHDSGDFFSEWYFLIWMYLAKKYPDVLVYFYTKMIGHLVRHQESLSKIPNFVAIQSEGGLFDDLIDYDKSHSKIATSLVELENLLDSGNYVDGNDKELGDLVAISGETRIVLPYHGTETPMI